MSKKNKGWKVAETMALELVKATQENQALRLKLREAQDIAEQLKNTASNLPETLKKMEMAFHMRGDVLDDALKLLRDVSFKAKTSMFRKAHRPLFETIETYLDSAQTRACGVSSEVKHE